MYLLLNLCIWIPLAGFIVNSFIPGRKETQLSWTAFVTVGVQGLIFMTLAITWAFSGFPSVDVKEAVLFQTAGYEFFIAFRFDKITAVYALVGSILSFLVTVYSRTYLHREKGYKRFFNNTLFFYTGYNIAIFAGNFETLFIGWEILGIASFLLIAFYRNRYLPVKNAVKVFSIYRIADVGILLVIWMSHHLWHENITFEKLNNYDLVHSQLQSDTLVGIFISLMILLSAAAKSAQLPFSSWLPRAMEGPTPSTAIFYGSLSVHIGVFLLLRTFPFWEHQVSVRIVIGLLGLLTSIVASGIARVQSSVKAQIAYASISQIGIIFIEVALGLTDIALLHFAGNAFLRTYQLLVSPSVVTYLIREQFYNYTPRVDTFEDSLPKRLEYSFYILCLKEWNLDTFMYRFYWNPMKWAGKKLSFLTLRNVLMVGIPVLIAGFVGLFNIPEIPAGIQYRLPGLLAFIGLMFSLKSFTERKNVKLSWILIVMNHFWIALAISFNEDFNFNVIVWYLSGVVIFGVVGFVCLRLLRILERKISLDRFHGHSFMYPGMALVFLIACLAVAGFPITPTFIGEDVILTHINSDQVFLAFSAAFSFIINGLAIIRIYARVFLGPHVHSMYDMAYRSS
jgi:NADH:ubiquinone oxidoreductase subunit 5 (subunit L)/multisubunit Na+/H+ antiporter MnhA subunit